MIGLMTLRKQRLLRAVLVAPCMAVATFANGLLSVTRADDAPPASTLQLSGVEPVAYTAMLESQPDILKPQSEAALKKIEPTALAAGVKVDANQSERLLATDNDAGEKRFSSAQTEPVRAEKPRLLLAILTPVNLFTGVLSCGLICILVIWMDRRELPPALQPPGWLVALNGLSAFVFLAIGLKGYWDNENREIVVISMLGIFAVATIVALLIGHKTGSTSR
jgi:hypothetical protein